MSHCWRGRWDRLSTDILWNTYRSQARTSIRRKTSFTRPTRELNQRQQQFRERLQKMTSVKHLTQVCVSSVTVLWKTQNKCIMNNHQITPWTFPFPSSEQSLIHWKSAYFVFTADILWNTSSVIGIYFDTGKSDLLHQE